MVDYYKILEVPRNSTSTDIKKAYRRLALKWHPDKNPDNKDEADRRFKEISEAYEVLSDENKRIVYDQYGKEGLPGRDRRNYSHHERFFGFPTFTFRDPEDVFREFFRGDPFEELFGSMVSTQQMQSALFTPSFGLNFGFRDGYPDLFNDGGFTSFSGSSFGNMSAVGGNVRRTSTSTRFINGKKIVTKKIMENGVETVTVLEDGVVKSKTVNGVTQALGY